MGIRIHKYLGYGLTNVEVKDYKIVDERIDWDAFDYLRDCYGEEHLKHYRQWLGWAKSDYYERGMLDWFYLNDEREKKRRGLDNCYAWDPEYGMPEVLVLQPLGCPDWIRYDDTIDYMEETYRKDGEQPQGNYLKVYEHGIYPWSSYIDRRTGEQVKDPIWAWIRATYDPEVETEVDVLDHLAQLCDFADHAEALVNVVPQIPPEIKNLVEFTEIFTNLDTVYDLRPVLYTYWS